MFGKKRPPKAPSPAPVPERAANAALPSAADTALAMAARAATSQARTRGLIGVLIATVFVLVWALAALAPLKERVPYFVTVNTDTGEVSAARQGAREFAPQDANVRYHLTQWLTNLLRMDPYLTTTELLPKASAVIRGPQARAQYNKWLAEDRPAQRLAEKPSLRRDVRVLALAPVAGARNTWLARVELTTRDGPNQVTTTKLVTIAFVIVAPETEAQVVANPLGLFVSDFTIQAER